MHRTLRRLLVLGVSGWVGLVSSGAAELILKPVADTAILGVNPDNNLGATPELPVGAVNRLEGEIRTRMLLRFDLSVLPAGAWVSRAVLGVEVLVKRDGSGPAAVGAHRLLRTWGEGSKAGLQGVVASEGEATWNERLKGGGAWAEPGGKGGVDFVAEASAVTTVDDLGPVLFSESAGLLEDVRKWQSDAGVNFGWILVGRDESVLASARRLGSREHPTASPTLRLEYSLPELVPFDSVGLQGDSIQLQFHANAGNVYTVWYRPALDSEGWLTLTNVVSKLVPAEAVVSDTPEDGVRYYQLAITGQVD
ncbi:MAG: DNRLRE domain-containing protein [Verrucomicrobiales bacterium]|nr:DNRLRE domain-containing protein [Verrucomicrobiales bacterium]